MTKNLNRYLWLTCMLLCKYYVSDIPVNTGIFLLEKILKLNWIGKEMSLESLNKDQEFRFGHVDISSAENGLCKCGIHKTNKLFLSVCDVFQRATPCEKIWLVINARACWNYLLPGHKARHCFKPKNCTIRCCTFWHHKSLHEAHSIGERFAGPE